MKFNQLAVAFIASSGKIASVGASAIDEYTLVGDGHCLPAGSIGTTNTHFGHAAGNIYLGAAGRQITTTDVTLCAQHCQDEDNIEGQVGFDITSYCYCRYTAGTGPQGITSDDGMSYKQPGSFGPIAGSDNNPSWAKCYIRNGFTGDAYGYVGDEYTFFGNGHCTAGAGSTAHFGHIANILANCPNVQTCATHCQSLNNVEGQVGFDINPGKTCYCRYTAGTGPESATSETGMSYKPGTTGQVAGLAQPSPDHICYSRNGFGQVSI